MQNTRLSGLAGSLSNQTEQLFRNPWRRLALQAIGLLFGIYLGIAIASIAGQTGALDVVVALIVVLLSEAISSTIHGGRWNLKQSVIGLSLNMLKLGVTYGLFVVAFFLGS